MKIKIKKILCIILFALILIPGAFVKISASATGATIGSISTFELIDRETGKDAIGVIVLKSKLKYIDGKLGGNGDPYIFAGFDFRNVKINVSGNMTENWETYFWKVSSLDENVATVRGADNVTDEEIQNTGGIYNNNCYLRVDMLNAGATVITLDISPNINMDGLVTTKTFTIKVVDDSKNGEIEATFIKGTNGAIINGSLDIKKTEKNVSISIASVV